MKHFKRNKKQYFTIEPGIPIPKKREFKISTEKYIYPFPEMMVGDSFACIGGYDARRVWSAAQTWRRRHGLNWEFIVRRDSNFDIRCWRVK